MTKTGSSSNEYLLGLLVYGDNPRISKETYRRIERNLYASKKYGISDTALHEGFDSVYGFYNHLAGLVALVKDVDRSRWMEFKK